MNRRSLAEGIRSIQEIKGCEVHDPEQVNSKHNAAKKRVGAVNNLGDFGRWDFLVCRDLGVLETCLDRMMAGDAGAVGTPVGPYELRA
ncbi:MAG: hypothetical protein NVSMB4_14070 [Acidimicrobiales bacterium]